MSRSFMCRQRHTAQTYRLLVMKNAIDVHRCIPPNADGRRYEISSSASLNNGNVTVHHHILGVSFPNDLSRAAHVVLVRLTIEQDFDVLPAKAQLLDTGSYLRRRSREVGVD